MSGFINITCKNIKSILNELKISSENKYRLNVSVS